MQYDVFISYASEDKDTIVRPLAEMLQTRGLKVWLDEFELKLGDSLRRNIDAGLANSRYGLVVLSPDFLKKEWPQKELDGLVAREDGSQTVILPIWHNVGHADITSYSPPLADKLAAPTSKGLQYVVDAVIKSIDSTSRNKGVLTPSVSPNSRAYSIDYLMVDLITRVNEIAEHGFNDVTGVRTGLLDIDRLTAGLQPGTLTLVAGRSLAGKTAFAIEVAQHVGTIEGLPVALFTPGVSARQTAERLLCSVGKLDAHHLRTAMLKDVEWGELSEAIDRLGKAPIYVFDESTTSIIDIQRECHHRATLCGALGAVVIDSLQDLVNTESGATDVCRELKRLSRDLNCPILITSNLTRIVEARIDKRPMLSDLEEVGKIDSHIDLAMFLYREIIYNPDSLEPDIVEVIVAKQRNSGVVGTLKIKIDRRSGKLVNLSPNDPR